MSDLLNHLVRWMSDGLRPGFPDDVPVRMWSWLEPRDPPAGSDGGRRPAAWEAREQVIRPRPPWGRVAAATLGLIEARDLLVPSRERVRILESRDHLDRLEQMRFRLRPVAALREHEAQVRLGRRQGDRIADRLRETDRALRICGRGLDRSKPEEIIDRVRQRVRRKAYVPRAEGNLRGPRERLRRRPGVPFAA